MSLSLSLPGAAGAGDETTNFMRHSQFLTEICFMSLFKSSLCCRCRWWDDRWLSSTIGSSASSWRISSRTNDGRWGILPPPHSNTIRFSYLNLYSVRPYLTQFYPVMWIRIRRIRMLLDLKDPDPSIFVRIRILPSSSKNSKKNLDLYCFMTFCLEDWCSVYSKSKK